MTTQSLATGNSQLATPTFRTITREEYPLIAPIMRHIIAGMDSYRLAPETTDDECMHYWFDRTECVFVAEENGKILGSYCLRTNHPHLGGHVANAGYMVAPEVRGHGIGKLLGEHSLEQARRLGYKAMQFNYVVSTNTPAVNLWKSLGFDIIGTIPGGFHHKRQKYVDVYIMYRKL